MPTIHSTLLPPSTPIARHTTGRVTTLSIWDILPDAPPHSHRDLSHHRSLTVHNQVFSTTNALHQKFRHNRATQQCRSRLFHCPVQRRERDTGVKLNRRIGPENCRHPPIEVSIIVFHCRFPKTPTNTKSNRRALTISRHFTTLT